VTYAPQSSPGLLRLPACALIACLAFAGPVAAQEEEALAAPTSLHKEPGGVPLVSLPAGAPVETGDARGAWNEATVDGWIATSSTAPTRREGFDLVVTPDGGENLRRSPNGPLLGRVREGTLLERVGKRGRWTKVRRAGWIPRKAITPPRTEPPPPAAVQQATRPAPPSKPAASDGAERVETTRETGLSVTPDGSALATMQAGTPARVLARSGDWTKIQVEGWVKEDALGPASGGPAVGVSAAEIRAEPDKFVGQTLEWRLQVIAVRKADELRPELPPGQSYLLTRGPLPEPGFVYVSIPEGQVARFQAQPALQEVVVRVTLRAARSRFLTTPVAELVSVVSGLDGK
jgi:hypothetical protein